MKTLGICLCAALGGALLLGGCGGDDTMHPTPDAGHDAGGGRDSGPPPDSGPPSDAGVDSGTMPGACPAGDCDLLANGCAAGQSCYFLTSSPEAGMPTPLCDMSGTGMDGDSCMSYQDCADGYFCLTAGSATMGTCTHYCCGGADDGCPTGQTCAVQFSDSSGNPLGVGYCKFPDTCDLVAQTGCPAGQSCFPNGSDGSVLCIAPGTDTENQPCMFTNDCVAGEACYGSTGGSSVCMKFCDMSATDPGCATGQTCQSIGAAFAPVGVCAPPMGA